MSRTASVGPVCGAAGCRADAAVRVTLPDGRQRVVCLRHVTSESSVIRNV